MSKNAALLLAGIVFFIIAPMHLLRIVFQLGITIGNSDVPMWASVLALVVSGIFCFLMFQAKNRM